MKPLYLSIACAALLATGCATSVAAQGSASQQDGASQLDDVFGDHMVLQRDQAITLRGSATAGASLTVGLAAQTRTITSDANDRWQVAFDPVAEGGPYTITLNGDAAAEDVLVGDVFLCTGQSNMEYSVSNALNSWYEINRQHDSRIRLLTMPKGNLPSEQVNFQGEAEWQLASSETVPDFSAVCYFTARELKPDVNVPIGLIDSSWGGSQIEAWMSSDALSAFEPYQDGLDLLQLYAADTHAGGAQFADIWENWWRGENPGSPDIWSDPAAFDWSAAPVPLRNWKDWGVADLAEYNGQVWYEAEFDVADGAEFPTSISLAAIDEVDLVWINGHFVGSQFGWATYRNYDLPEGIVKLGKNSVVVSIFSSWDMGGFFGPAEDMYVTSPDDSRIALADWDYYLPEKSGMNAPRAPWESISGITGLHNAMIAPLRNLGLKGVLWYQGESDTGDGDLYEGLLTALAAGWQSNAGHDVKTLVIQLPEFGPMADAPVESGWAALRESQRRAAAANDDIALVVTMGTGNPADIHPANKQEVARRTANAARRVLYGQDVADTNRDPISAVRVGDSIVVTLAGETRGLKTWSSDRAIGFELCDPSGCAFASGAVEQNRILIDVQANTTPNRVRYNWSDTPRGNLADPSGLPVGSFEVSID